MKEVTLEDKLILQVKNLIAIKEDEELSKQEKELLYGAQKDYLYHILDNLEQEL